jgi:large subunit ribosomal protein L9
MLKVILRQDVSGIGKTGEAKQVKDGFARNYLFPKNLAVVATEHNLHQIETDRKKAEAKKVQELQVAREAAEKLQGLSVTLTADVNEEEKLYGSLTSLEIAKAVSVEGVTIDKKMILLETPIKALGIYDVPVRLHADVTAMLKVWVVKK